jgi:hypothetical protein
VEVTSLNPCIAKGPLTEAVEAWLGRDTVDARLRVRVTSARETEVALRLGEEPEVLRHFQELPGDCPTEEKALALSIALAIDAVAPAPPEPPAPENRLGAAVLVTTGFPGRPALGGELSINRRIAGALRVEAAALGAATARQTLRADLPVTFTSGLIAGRVAACGALPLASALEGQGCAGAALGATFTRGPGVRNPRTESQAWPALVASLGLHLRMTAGFGLFLAADALVPLRDGTIRATEPDGTDVTRPFPGLLAAFRLGPTASF